MSEYSFSQELGFTHAEFFKNLPPAIGHRDYTIEDNLVTVSFGEGRSLTFELGPEQVRKIALLRMRYCVVTYTYYGFIDEHRQAFQKRFDLYFQKGGG